MGGKVVKRKVWRPQEKKAKSNFYYFFFFSFLFLWQVVK